MLSSRLLLLLLTNLPANILRTMSIPSSAIYMLGYEYLLTKISPLFTDAPTATLTPAPLVAGALARTFSATIISPIEMFRTRLQALPMREYRCHGRRAATDLSSSLICNLGRTSSCGLRSIWAGTVDFNL